MNASFGNQGTAMRKDKPKRKQEFWENSNIRKEEFRNQHGEWHNAAGPAVRWWHENGQLAYEIYYLNGELHNAAGPAVRRWKRNGNLGHESYYLNDRWLTYQALLHECEFWQ
jgi:antitoxin component YwqK of YwqJK toxin-antitoxin module